MDTLNQATAETLNPLSDKKKRIIIIVAIVVGSLTVLGLISGLIVNLVMQNMYNEAFYRENVTIEERPGEYAEEALDVTALEFIPSEMIVEASNTVYSVGETVDRADFTVRIRYFDGEKTVEKEVDSWYFKNPVASLTDSVGSKSITVQYHVTTGNNYTVAAIDIPVTVVDNGGEASEKFNGTVRFSDYYGGYNLDPLAVYSEETLNSIKDGYNNFPIYKKEQINEDIFNFLVIGGGDTKDSNDIDRAGSIMLVSYNQNTDEVKVITLLGDTLVPIEGYGWNKLRIAYRIGGPGLLVNTVNEVYGLDIQYYVEMRLDKIETLVDRLGGVTVDVTAEEIDSLGLEGLTPGKCLIKGENVHKWLVYNHGGVQALDHTNRQSRVIKQLIADYATGEKSLSEFVSICSEDDYIVTNLPYGEFMSTLYSVVTNLSDIKYTHTSLPEKIGEPYVYVVYNKSVSGIRITPEDLKKLTSQMLG